MHHHFTRQPALDGLRAVSVALVLAYHAGFGWMSGGYLGVSVFFTLSGYLITSLLLVEHDGTGSIDVAGFYARRMRRLLPASLLCVVAVVVAAAFGAFSGVAGLRADAAGAVFQVFNWVQLAGGTSYGDLFLGGTSPLEHYWSLSIEEQYYWVWPVAMVGLLRVSRNRHHRGRRLTVVMTAIAALFSVVAVAIAQVWGPDAAYWATPARVPEILIGAAVACLLSSGHVVHPGAGRWAMPALAAVVALSCTLPSGSGLAYQGALPAFALVTASLLYALQAPGLVRTALSWRPLVWIGGVSYGIYLFHWPVFVLLRERGWQLDTLGGAVVAIAITVAIAALSARLIELPVRRAVWPTAKTIGLAVAATAVAAVASLAVVAPTPLFTVDEDALNQATIPSGESVAALLPAPASTTPSTTPSMTPSTTPSTTPRTTPRTTPSTIPAVVELPPPPSRPVRILVGGDSTAVVLTVGMASWAAGHPDHAAVSSRWCPGCGFLLEGEIVTAGMDSEEPSAAFTGTQLLASVDSLQPDVVVLMSTITDVADRVWPDDDRRIGPTDPRYRAALTEAYADITMRLLAAGAPHVVWIVPPVPLAVLNGPEMNEPERYEVQHAVIRETVARFTGSPVSAIDLEGWMVAADHASDSSWRPDGVHLTEEAAAVIAEQFLGPLLVATALS